MRMFLKLRDKLLYNTWGLYMATSFFLLPGFDTDHDTGKQCSDMALCSLFAQLTFLNSLLLDTQGNFGGQHR